MEDQIESIYDALTGMRPHLCCGEEVENLFAEGSPCSQLYEEVYNAKVSLMERLGMTDEDEQIELIIDNLLEIGRIQTYAMFHWGWRLAKEETTEFD